MIKFLTTEEVLPLRNEVLREGKLKPEDCVFVNDDHEDTFHIGYFDGDEVVCIASFHAQKHPEYEGKAYQLRGMATKSNYQGKGIGNKLLNFAIVYLRGKKINYLWCNAREKAFKFYLSLGFEFISEPFIIEGIGVHKVMYLRVG